MAASSAVDVCAEIAQRVGAYYAKRYAAAYAEDFAQDAWVAMLEALKRYDAARSELPSYLAFHARAALLRSVVAGTTSLTIRDRNAAALPYLAQQAANNSVPDALDEMASPVDLDELLDRARVRQQVHALVTSRLSASEAAAVLAVLAGEPSNKVAAEYKMPVARLYKITHAAKNLVREQVQR